MAAAPAWAQSPANERRWEIEGYGGLMVVPTGSGGGTAVLPQPGPPIATSSPIFPSRRVPSWFFGDGALLLNQVNGQFDVAALIQPLDGALGESGLAAANGFTGGLRVRRAVTARFSAEFSFDLFPASAHLSEDFLAAVDATRASFVPAFEGLLATGPFTDVNVEASSVTSGSTSEVAATGALVYQLGSAGGFDPYLTFGGGVITGAGDAPAVTLEGRYRSRILGEVPLDETDRVTIRHESRTVLTAVVGAGLRRDVSDRWGVRVDGRVLIGSPTTRILIDTDPTVAQGTPADFVESFTAPAIQFSNNPSTGRESSLGGPPLQGFEAYVESGLRARVLITAGVFVRF
jgi:hypothetical protein